MNLLLRTLSALILLPVALIALFNGGWILSSLIALIFVLGAYEFSAMVFKEDRRLAILISIFAALAAVLCQAMGLAIGLASFAFLIGTYFVFHPDLTSRDWEKSITLTFVFPYLGASLFSVHALRNETTVPADGIAFILVALLSVWSSDIFAYFVGKSIGRHKLYERVSAKKTWEGFFGGAFGCVLIPLLAHILLRYLGFDVLSGISTADILWISVPTIILAPLGDLIESRFKRLYGVKDSGKILPGHGGILDRIDAILFVMPWTYTYVFVIRPIFEISGSV